MAPNSIPQRERSDADQVTALFGVRIRGRPTFFDVAGLLLVFVVLGLMAAFVGSLLLYWMLATPPVEAFGNPIT